MDNKVKELLTNSFLFTLASLGSKVLVFLMVPFYTYILTKEEYGVAGVVQTTASLLFPLVTAKISDAVLRFCFKKDINNRQVLTIGLEISILGFLLASLLTAILSRFTLFDEVGSLIIFVPFLVFASSLSQLGSFFSRGIGNVRGSAISGVINTLVVVSLNLLFLLRFKLGVTGYLSSYVIADVVSFIYLFFSSKIYSYVTITIDKELRKKMLVYSLPLVPTSLSWWLLSSFNNYYILSVLGASVVGLYTAALRVPSILTVLSDIFSQAWLLSALKDYGSEENRKFIKSVHKRFFAMLCFLTGGITLLSYPISRLLLLGEFISGWRIIPFLFVSVFWGALVGFYGSIFSAENKTKIQLYSTLLGALVSVLIVVCFLKPYGLTIVAIATVVGYYVVWLVRKEVLKKYIDVGMSTMMCTLYGFLLSAIAFLVIKELYVLALSFYILLLVLNRTELISISCFFYKETVTYIKKRL